MRKYANNLLCIAALTLLVSVLSTTEAAHQSWKYIVHAWQIYAPGQQPVDYSELKVELFTDDGGIQLMGKKRGKVVQYKTPPAGPCVVQVQYGRPSITRYFERTGCTITRNGEELVFRDGDSFARLAVSGKGNEVYAVARNKGGDIIWERTGSRFSQDEGFGTINCRATVSINGLLATIWSGRCWILTGPELERGVFLIDTLGRQTNIDVVTW
jgi:hypothetical protein